jgi:hypothetical protein
VCCWMPREGPHRGERIRAAEVAAALCLATDLGMGFPFEHGLHSTLTAMRLGQRLGVDRETASQTYYACLLTYSGCTADADITAETFGGSMATHFAPVTFGSERERLSGIVRALPMPESPAPVRAIQIARRLPKAARERDPHLAAICEVAQMLSERLGLPKPVGDLFVDLTNGGTARGICGAPRGRRSRCLCGSRRSPATPACTACLAGMSLPPGSSANERAMHLILRSPTASRMVPRRFSRASTKRPLGTRRWLASHNPR